MLNCKEVVTILSSKEPENWRERIQLKFHLLMCHHCAKYAKQIEALKSGVKNIMQKSNVDDSKIKRIEDQVLKKIQNKK